MQLLRFIRRGVAAIVVTALLLAAGSSPAAAVTATYLQITSYTQYFFCLDVDADTAGNVRTNVQLYTCHGTTEAGVGYQAFTAEGIPGQPAEYLKLRNKATNKCLTYNVNGVPSSSPATAVWAESCNKAGQGWKRRSPYVATKQYEAVEFPNRCLDTEYADGRFRSGIDVFTCDTQGSWINWREWEIQLTV